MKKAKLAIYIYRLGMGCSNNFHKNIEFDPEFCRMRLRFCDVQWMKYSLILMYCKF